MENIRIGIIGTENSHANTFAGRINNRRETGEYLYPECRVSCVYGHYPESNAKIAEKYGIDKVANTIDEMLGEVDAVIVTARDGKYHCEFAKPFINAGIPAFIDKPFTVDERQAAELVELAKKKNVSICGGSSLKYSATVSEAKAFFANPENEVIGGALSAPVMLGSEYSGFFFYASHLTEMTLEIFGYNPESITASLNKNGVCASVNYGDFTVSNHFMESACNYSIGVFGKKKLFIKEADLTGAGERECDDFINMVRTGNMPYDYDKLMKQINVLNYGMNYKYIRKEIILWI